MINAIYGSGLTEAAIETKQAVFPWELKIRGKTQGVPKKQTIENDLLLKFQSPSIKLNVKNTKFYRVHMYIKYLTIGFTNHWLIRFV